jgi:hypothetical protein
MVDWAIPFVHLPVGNVLDLEEAGIDLALERLLLLSRGRVRIKWRRDPVSKLQQSSQIGLAPD